MKLVTCIKWVRGGMSLDTVDRIASKAYDLLDPLIENRDGLLRNQRILVRDPFNESKFIGHYYAYVRGTQASGAFPVCVSFSDRKLRSLDISSTEIPYSNMVRALVTLKNEYNV